jgi:hypothetical protein
MDDKLMIKQSFFISNLIILIITIWFFSNTWYLIFPIFVVLFLFLSLLLLFCEQIIAYIDARFFQATDATFSHRTKATNMILSQSIFTLIVGIGFNYQGYGLTITDLGLFLSSYAQFSIFGLLLFLLGYILLKYDFLSLTMFILMILSKLSSIYPILWIYFALIVSKSNLFYLMEREKYDEK